MEGYGVASDAIVSLTTNSTYYNVLNHQWNLRKTPVFPVAFFLPLNTQHVQFAVRCGSKVGVQLIPSSGAHSYEAISYGDNSTIIVDFRKMKNIEISKEQGRRRQATATIQPGAMVGPITAYLWKNGGYGMPMGNCMTVGMGGHAIGGGVGYYTALYGLVLDNLVEVEMVDAKGQVVIASAIKNPELFWALRGSGPGYLGIVTRVKVKLFKASNIKMTFITFHYKVNRFAEVWEGFQRWVTWMNEHEPTILSGIVITNGEHEKKLKFGNIRS